VRSGTVNLKRSAPAGVTTKHAVTAPARLLACYCGAWRSRRCLIS